MRRGLGYVIHKGSLVDGILGVEYQHFDLNAACGFCVNPAGAPAAVRDFDLPATRPPPPAAAHPRARCSGERSETARRAPPPPCPRRRRMSKRLSCAIVVFRAGPGVIAVRQ
jgi:hypothetical protein